MILRMTSSSSAKRCSHGLKWYMANWTAADPPKAPLKTSLLSPSVHRIMMGTWHTNSSLSWTWWRFLPTWLGSSETIGVKAAWGDRRRKSSYLESTPWSTLMAKQSQCRRSDNRADSVMALVLLAYWGLSSGKIAFVTSLEKAEGAILKNDNFYFWRTRHNRHECRRYNIMCLRIP